MEGILFIIFLCSTALLAAYYLLVLLASRGKKTVRNAREDAEGISVVVVSRNGLENLRALIPSLLAQKHLKFEIVVVNDRSFDNTEIFIKSVQRNYPTVLHMATIPLDTTYPWAGKKFAIAMGVKAAKYDRIVLLDNTAVPAGERWLETMARAFEGDRKEFLIGCTAAGNKGGLYTASEFCRMADYMAWAGAGLPFSARPSNFGFRKSTFLARNGYMKDMRVPAGEADFLLQDCATGKNTAIVCSRDVLVTDNSAFTAAERRERDVARYAAFRHYLPSARAKALTAPFLKALFLVAAVACGVFFWARWEYWAALAVPMVLSWVTGWICARRFVYPRWMALGILLDVVLLPWDMIRLTVASALLPKGWK